MCMKKRINGLSVCILGVERKLSQINQLRKKKEIEMLLFHSKASIEQRDTIM